ncbi:MAG: hypothetical protein AAGA97_05630 [Pseudomonadota bacterium]
MGSISEEYLLAARERFRKSQEADPNFARLLAMDVCSWSNLADFDLVEAEEKLNRAMQLDAADPELHRILGTLHIRLNKDYDASRRHHEWAMELAPNDAYILGRCAAFYVFDGQPERALELPERAEHLDPLLPVWIVEDRVAALYALGRFAEANEEARSLNFQTRRSRLYRAASRVARGGVQRARELVAEALADDPNLSGEYVKSQELLRENDRLDALLDRLRSAGLTDTPTISAHN